VHGGHKYLVITWTAVLLIYIAAAAEMFRAKISAWDMVKIRPEINKGLLEYTNARTPGPIHLNFEDEQ
jgi:hypothetical protein